MNRIVKAIQLLLIPCCFLLVGCQVTVRVEPLSGSGTRPEPVETPTPAEERAIADKFCILKPNGGGFTSGGGGFTSGGGGFTSGGGGRNPHGLLVWSTVQQELAAMGASRRASIARDPSASEEAYLRQAATHIDGDSVALLVIDQFSRIDEETGERIYVYVDPATDVETATRPPAEVWSWPGEEEAAAKTVLLYPVDIGVFRTDIVEGLLEQAFAVLGHGERGAGVNRFVLNMSWMILPCGERQPKTVDEYIDVVCDAPRHDIETITGLEAFFQRYGADDLETLCSDRSRFAEEIALADFFDVRYFDSIWAHPLIRSAWTTGYYERFARDDVVDFRAVAETFEDDPFFQQVAARARPRPDEQDLVNALTAACEEELLWSPYNRILERYRAGADMAALCRAPAEIGAFVDAYAERDGDVSGLAAALLAVRTAYELLSSACDDRELWDEIDGIFELYGVDFVMAQRCPIERAADVLEVLAAPQNAGLAAALAAQGAQDIRIVAGGAAQTLARVCADPSSNGMLLEGIKRFLDARGVSLDLCAATDDLLALVQERPELASVGYVLAGQDVALMHAFFASEYVVNVAAAGNSAQKYPYAPALWDGVVSASAADCACEAEPAFYSNHGEVMLDGRHPGRGGLIGTSYAAPRLSAQAARHLADEGASPCLSAPSIAPALGYMPETQGDESPDWRNLPLEDAVLAYCREFLP